MEIEICAEVDMVAHHMQEWLIVHERAGAVDGMPVTERFRLCNKKQALDMIACRVPIGGFIAGTDHDTALFDTSLPGLIQNNGKDGFLYAVTVDQHLQRERAPVTSGGSDYSSGNFQGHRSFCRNISRWILETAY